MSSEAGARQLLVDALNLAYWCGTPPSLRVPLSVLAQLVAAGHEAQLVFDASAPYRLEQERAIYTRLLEHHRHVVEVPSGRAADKALLKAAAATGAVIISRDRFRDHRRKYRRIIDDPARIVDGWVQEGCVQLPALALVVPLAASAAEAWERLQRLCQD